MENNNDKDIINEHKIDEIEPCIICSTTKYSRQRFIKVPEHEDNLDELFNDDYGI